MSTHGQDVRFMSERWTGAYSGAVVIISARTDSVSMLPYFSDWPRVQNKYQSRSQEEKHIRAILGQMTLEEKVGQMIQPEMQQLTPEEAGRYKFGSALNGAGVWPSRNKHTSAKEWASTVDAYWVAVDEAFQRRPFRIPFMWAVDAIHGNNNLFGATIFPHNIGLGAANDPRLIEQIGQATAREIAACGMDWTFAPTVAVPRDFRWGRHFEGYSDDPEIVYRYAGCMVRGLQGETSADQSVCRIVSSVKHWIGDGGTCCGIDRGITECSEEDLLNVHGMGYVSALAAGAYVVMVSFSSWKHFANYDHAPEDGIVYNYKLHGSRYLIHDVLKQKMGFDGVVVTDWDGHGEVSKCSLGDARYAFNAGVDVLMVEARRDWQSVYFNAIEDVQAGRISLARIDDAVERILRMKFRAGLWDTTRPIKRAAVRNAGITGCEAHRRLAREAVRKSLVLLKNRSNILPIQLNSRILLTGSAADNIQKQMGGWSLSWQGIDVTPEDFPHACTLAKAVAKVVGSENCFLDPLLQSANPGEFDVALVAIGEDSYAEMKGDIRPWRTLEYAALKPSYFRDREILQTLRKAHSNIVTIFFSGRPLYLNEEINLSDAFVAAWLPGGEAEGITDVLIRAEDGSIGHDFQGRLPCRWPATKRAFATHQPPRSLTNAIDPIEIQPEVLFPRGFGLSYRKKELSARHNAIDLPINIGPALPPAIPARRPLQVLGPQACDKYCLRIAGNGFWVGSDVSRCKPTDALLGRLEPIDYLGAKDAIAADFNGRIASIYVRTEDQQPEDLRGYLLVKASLAFDIKLQLPPQGTVLLACHDCYPSQGAVNITSLLKAATQGHWTTIRVPLSELERHGSEFQHINTPFMLYTENRMTFVLGNIRWEICESS